MKNWWLKLYTIPSLIITARSTAIVFTATILLYHFVPDFLFSVGWLSCYIVYAQRDLIKNSFGKNIEFHKLHIPFNQLKKAVITDGVIRGSAIILGSFICNFFAYIHNGFAGVGSEAPALIIGPLAMQLFFISNMTTVNSVINGKLRYVVVDSTKFNKFVFFIAGVILYAAITVLLAGPALYGFSIPYLLTFCALGFFIQYRKRIYQLAFHQDKSIETYKRYYVSSGKDLLTGAALYFLAMIVSYPMINSQYVDMSIRESAFKIVGVFSPSLDIETAKEFIKENRYSRYELENIFRHSPDLNQVPISEILDKPRMSEYVAYLENVENPSVENLNYIMANPIKRNERNGNLYSELNKLVVEKWPKNQKFPEHLLDKTVLTERLPASKK